MSWSDWAAQRTFRWLNTQILPVYPVRMRETNIRQGTSAFQEHGNERPQLRTTF